MDDLRFMIVNSNLPHSQALKSELDNRVSFDVYQDTKEKNVWGLMEGGKDDVYVYDRCGRLAYYIPFPLSIMTAEDNLVRSAIIATYFRSPCGDTCDQIGKNSLEEFLNGNTDAPESTTNVALYTSDYQEIVASNKSVEISKNETVLPEYDEFLTAAENGTDLFGSDDLDYSVSNETAYEDSNITLPIRHKHNDLHTVLHNNRTLDDVEESNSTSFTNDSLPTINPRNITNDNPSLIDIHHSHSESNETEIIKTKPSKSFVPKRKFDRCAEADYSVCENWSKRRLLRAQTCCSIDYKFPRIPDNCKNYGKKRCKKIRTVLKCCIKTEYVETTTAELTTVAYTMTVEDVTEVVPLICCSDSSKNKACRVSDTGSCEVGEFVQEKVQPTDTAQTESTN